MDSIQEVLSLQSLEDSANVQHSGADVYEEEKQNQFVITVSSHAARAAATILPSRKRRKTLTRLVIDDDESSSGEDEDGMLSFLLFSSHSRRSLVVHIHRTTHPVTHTPTPTIHDTDDQQSAHDAVAPQQQPVINWTELRAAATKLGPQLRALREDQDQQSHNNRETYSLEHVQRLFMFPPTHDYSKPRANRMCSKHHDQPCKLGCKSCHFCRQRTTEVKTVCSLCEGVNNYYGGPARGYWCGSCLWLRMGENIDEVRKNPNWICPGCRDLCNCSGVNCMRIKKGWFPTNQLSHEAMHQGFKSVAHYLVLTHVSANASVVAPPIADNTNVPRVVGMSRQRDDGQGTRATAALAVAEGGRSGTRKRRRRGRFDVIGDDNSDDDDSEGDGEENSSEDDEDNNNNDHDLGARRHSERYYVGKEKRAKRTQVTMMQFTGKGVERAVQPRAQREAEEVLHELLGVRPSVLGSHAVGGMGGSDGGIGGALEALLSDTVNGIVGGGGGSGIGGSSRTQRRRTISPMAMTTPLLSHVPSSILGILDQDLLDDEDGGGAWSGGGPPVLPPLLPPRTHASRPSPSPLLRPETLALPSLFPLLPPRHPCGRTRTATPPTATITEQQQDQSNEQRLRRLAGGLDAGGGRHDSTMHRGLGSDQVGQGRRVVPPTRGIGLLGTATAIATAAVAPNTTTIATAPGALRERQTITGRSRRFVPRPVNDADAEMASLPPTQDDDTSSEDKRRRRSPSPVIFMHDYPPSAGGNDDKNELLSTMEATQPQGDELLEIEDQPIHMRQAIATEEINNTPPPLPPAPEQQQQQQQQQSTPPPPHTHTPITSIEATKKKTSHP